MKLLLDQNISYRVAREIQAPSPEIYHVSEVGLLNSSDDLIWKFAKENNYIIVTFDADFYELQMLRGFPPKIIWLRFGNTTRKEMIEFFNRNIREINQFISSTEFESIGCLEFF